MVWLWEALSQVVTNIFMEHFEKMALDTSQYKPSHAFIEVREASD
jgi:hypothetical protein